VWCVIGVAESAHGAPIGSADDSLIAMGVMTAKNALAGLDGKLNPELVLTPLS
jgi:hypothetical protein